MSSGLLTGLLLRSPLFNEPSPSFTDDLIWDVPEEEKRK